MKIIFIIIGVLFLLLLIIFLYCSLVIAKQYDNELDRILDLNNRK